MERHELPPYWPLRADTHPFVYRLTFTGTNGNARIVGTDTRLTTKEIATLALPDENHCQQSRQDTLPGDRCPTWRRGPDGWSEEPLFSLFDATKKEP